MVRILVVDDHAMVRRGICRLVTAEPDFCVVAEASSGFEAVAQATKHQPDIVLLDLGIPEMNGLQAARLIRKAVPNAGILMVTQYDNPFFAREAFAAGAGGFVLKNDLRTQLVTAVRDVCAKKPFISKSVNVRLPDGGPLAPAAGDR